MTVFISNLSLAKSNYYHDNQNGQKAVTLNKVAIHWMMLCCIKNQVIILKKKSDEPQLNPQNSPSQ